MAECEQPTQAPTALPSTTASGERTETGLMPAVRPAPPRGRPAVFFMMGLIAAVATASRLWPESPPPPAEDTAFPPLKAPAPNDAGSPPAFQGSGQTADLQAIEEPDAAFGGLTLPSDLGPLFRLPVPTSYHPEEFAWAVSLNGGVFVLLNGIRVTGGQATATPLPLCGEGEDCYGTAFQSFRSRPLTAGFSSWMNKKITIFDATGTRCDAVVEDLGDLAWFWSCDGCTAALAKSIRGVLRTLPNGKSRIPADSPMAGPNSGDSIDNQLCSILANDRDLAARVTLHDARFSDSLYKPLQIAAKVRIVDKTSKCRDLEALFARTADLDYLRVMRPEPTTMHSLSLDRPHLWPNPSQLKAGSLNYIIKDCCSDSTPLSEQFDFRESGQTFIWKTSDGTQYAWALGHYSLAFDITDGPEKMRFEPGTLVQGLWKRTRTNHSWVNLFWNTGEICDSCGSDGTESPLLIISSKAQEEPEFIFSPDYGGDFLTNTKGVRTSERTLSETESCGY